MYTGLVFHFWTSSIHWKLNHIPYSKPFSTAHTVYIEHIGTTQWCSMYTGVGVTFVDLIILLKTEPHPLFNIILYSADWIHWTHRNNQMMFNVYRFSVPFLDFINTLKTKSHPLLKTILYSTHCIHWTHRNNAMVFNVHRCWCYICWLNHFTEDGTTSPIQHHSLQRRLDTLNT